jgi:hypothetical protein
MTHRNRPRRTEYADDPTTVSRSALHELANDAGMSYAEVVQLAAEDRLAGVARRAASRRESRARKAGAAEARQLLTVTKGKRWHATRAAAPAPPPDDTCPECGSDIGGYGAGHVCTACGYVEDTNGHPLDRAPTWASSPRWQGSRQERTVPLGRY